MNSEPAVWAWGFISAANSRVRPLLRAEISQAAPALQSVRWWNHFSSVTLDVKQVLGCACAAAISWRGAEAARRPLQLISCLLLITGSLVVPCCCFRPERRGQLINPAVQTLAQGVMKSPQGQMWAAAFKDKSLEAKKSCSSLSRKAFFVIMY